MDRTELIKRLKAARALGGFSSPQALGNHPLLVENGIKESRIREFESAAGRVSPRPMELRIIASACGLPEVFFEAPMERLEDPATSERIGRLEASIDELRKSVGVIRLELARPSRSSPHTPPGSQRGSEATGS